MSETSTRRARCITALLGVLALGACSPDRVNAPVLGQGDARMFFSASVAATTINTLVVSVTASDISTPLVFNIPVTDGSASGTIAIPAGSDRLITVRAYDTDGNVSHEGSKSVTVKRGVNAPVTIILLPTAGDQGLEVHLTSVTISVESSAASVRAGRNVTVTATITDGFGNVVPGPVQWATMNPAFATVSSSGNSATVHGVAAGDVDIVATYAGVGGSTSLTVTPEGFTLIATGITHTCGIGTTGTTYCWGTNNAGQLGQGLFDGPVNTPTAVLTTLNFSQLGGGSNFTCGLASGAAYCWGIGGSGQLGNGAFAASNVPVPVAGGLTFTSISTGDTHACGRATNGAAYCWGSNSNGQLGNGSNTSSNVPVPVSGGLVFATVSAGSNFTCGRMSNGTAHCWGANAQGQLGDGTNINSNVPVPVSGGVVFTLVESGYQHSCGRATNGTSWCWGWNDVGQLGTGVTGTNSNVPLQVTTPLTFNALSVGDPSCGLSSGSAYCWGYNVSGQLGNGGGPSSNVPTEVSGGLLFTMISASNNHVCAISNFDAYCWGANNAGQLGTGSFTNSNVPVKVNDP